MSTNTRTPNAIEVRPGGDLDPSTAFAPYAGAWSAREAAHLWRRAGFGGSAADIAAAVSAGMAGAVDRLVTFAPDTLPPRPAADLSYGPMVSNENRAKAVLATQLWWLDRVLRSPNPLQEKMVLFWGNHFTSFLGDKGITPNMAVAQNALFREYALGNYANLTKEMTRDPAMLLYLDGVVNRKQHPNENYARELLELFTMGVGNYSEADIRDVARAFTGNTLDRTGKFVFVAGNHDSGDKTIFGRTGDYTGDDVVELIMEQPATGRFIARKLLRAFVYDDPEPVLVEILASRFRRSGYDTRAMIDMMLRSTLFYSPRAYRALVKSPVELVVGAMRLVGAMQASAPVLYAIAAMGQTLMRPPNVAGWPGGPMWLNQNQFLLRVNFLNRLVMGSAQDVLGLASASPVMGVYQSMDAGVVAERVLALVLQGDVTPTERRALVDYLSTDGVGNKVLLSPENFDEKLRGAMSLAMKIPAYQLA